MIFLYIYLVVCVAILTASLYLIKKADGGVSVRDITVCALFSFLPLFNLVLVSTLGVQMLDDLGVWNKKIF